MTRIFAEKIRYSLGMKNPVIIYYLIFLWRFHLFDEFRERLSVHLAFHHRSGIIHENTCSLLNSAQTIAAAVDTFSDSDVGSPGGYDGINKRRLMYCATTLLIPFDSLPITITALDDRGTL